MSPANDGVWQSGVTRATCTMIEMVHAQAVSAERHGWSNPACDAPYGSRSLSVARSLRERVAALERGFPFVPRWISNESSRAASLSSRGARWLPTFHLPLTTDNGQLTPQKLLSYVPVK